MAATRLTWVRIWLGAMLLWLLPGMSAAAEGDKPPFFEFEYAGKKVYLLGSIHVGKADFYPMPTVVEQAFSDADALVLEADTGAAPQILAQLLKQYGLTPATPDAPTAALLAQYCHDYGRECAAMEAFSPWLMASHITMTRFASQGYRPELGVDASLLKRARGNKTILELEGVEYQFALLSSLAVDDQWAMVREAITGKETELEGLVSAWRGGDSAKLAALMEGSMSDGDNTQLQKTLLWDRNARMASKLLTMLTTPDTPKVLMVVVGAGHLVGEQSLVEVLSNRGLRLSAPLGHCAASGC